MPFPHDATAARLLLIRHAHVDTGEPPGRLCGTLDLPLSPKGRSQVQQLLKCAPPEQPSAIYTSPLRRARDTAAALGQLWGLAVQPDAALGEIDCGRFEGRAIADIMREERELWARNEAQNEDAFAWPGGETYASFRLRIAEALSRIAANHPGERVAVVTHAGVVAQVMGLLQGRPAAAWEHDRPDPLACTEVIWSGGSPVGVTRFNDRGWLAEARRPGG